MITASLKLFILIAITSLTTQKLTPLINSIRSSALVTLTMIGLLHFFITSYDNTFFHGAIFAASFLGMTNSKKVPPFQLVLGSLVLTFLLQTPWVLGSKLGGTLGLCAFISCLTPYFIQKLIAKSNS
jgi:hypothetical protein